MTEHLESNPPLLSTDLSRRRLLGLLASAAMTAPALGWANSAHAASTKAKAKTSTTKRTRATTTSAVAASTTTTTVPSDRTGLAFADRLVRVDANEKFRFSAGLGNGSGGESAPIASAYWLSKYMVTNAEWAEFVATGGATAPTYWGAPTPPDERRNHPVAFVAGTDAVKYCGWLTDRNPGWTVRLPTEAEWENAAHEAGAAYPWGLSPSTTLTNGTLRSRYNYNAVVSAWALANHRSVTYSSRSSKAGQSVALADLLSVGPNGEVRGWIDHATNTGFVFTTLFESIAAAGGFTTAVGTYADGTTPSGIHDMAGNLWEWTSSVVLAANGAEAGTSVNAIRGGSWYATSRSCTTTYRGEGRSLSGAYSTVGLRVAAVPR